MSKKRPAPKRKLGGKRPAAKARPQPTTPEKATTNKNAPVGTGSLLPAEQTLLKLASNKYYYNREGVPPGSPHEHPFLMLGYINLRGPSAHSKIADHVAYRQIMNDEFYQATNERSSMAGELQALWANTVLDGMKRGLLGEESLSFEEFRRGPGEPWERWGDRLRQKELIRAQSLVLMTQAAVDIAKEAETYFGPRVAMAPFATPPFTIYPHFGDEVGAMFEGKRVYAHGWYAKVIYTGQQPLTNVMLVSHVGTNGPSTALNEGQAFTLAFNRTTNFEEAAGDLKRVFEFQNYYATMPKSMFVLIPTLKPGDVVHMPMGDSELKVEPKARLSIYSDQGYLKDRPLELTRWMFNGCSQEVIEVIKPGMNRDSVITQLGELDKTDRAAWLAVGKTKTDRLPADADYCRWGRSKHLPVLYMAFRGDKLDTLELIVPPRPKPAIAGIPLKLGGRGSVSVKSALSKDDPQDQSRRGPCKVYSVPLKAGKTYVIRMSSLATNTTLRVENEYGDDLKDVLGTMAPYVGKGFPTTPQPWEAILEFSPKADGEYRIVCKWLLVTPRQGDFTLAVQMK